MISKLKTEPKVVGIKQSRKAIANGAARCVFLAEDADPMVTEPFVQICGQEKIPTVAVPTMRELGAACGISVGAAVAVLLN